MFERFTDRARRVVVLAQDEARLLRHNYIGTEHILLGLVQEGEGVAAKVLDRLGISLDAVRSKVEDFIGEGGPGAPEGHIPFTPRSKKVLELSLREALQLGHNYIGTEHILLGLIREGKGVGAEVLVSLGAELSAVRQEVVQQLSGYRVSPGGARWSGPLGPRPRETPAAAKAGVEARRLAGAAAVGSQHYLLGLLHDQASLAAKALLDLGVTREAVEAKLAELEPAGTSDETPEQAGARRINLRVEGQSLTLEVDDPDLAAALAQAMAGRTVRVVRGTDPEAEAAGFPNLWVAVSRTVDELTRRLTTMAGVRPTVANPAAYWRPPEIGPGPHAARYWMVNMATGPAGYLEVGPGGDREAVRAWLADWLRHWRGLGLPRPGGAGPPGTDCAVLWMTVVAAGDSFAIGGYGSGPDGPAGSTPAPLDEVAKAAIDDLSMAV